MAKNDTEHESPEDRRESERIPARVGVRFRGSSEVARAIKAFSLNFSVGGLCIRTQKQYEVGAPLDLAMTIDDREFAIKGVVAWVRGGAIGVRFVDVSDDDRLKLTEMVSRLRPD